MDGGTSTAVAVAAALSPTEHCGYRLLLLALPRAKRKYVPAADPAFTPIGGVNPAVCRL